MVTRIASPTQRQDVRHTPPPATAQGVIAKAKADATAIMDLRARMSRMPGYHAQDFNTSDLIHIKNGSLFISPYMVANPRELAPTPEKEAKFTAKLRLTNSINNPHFYEMPGRYAVAMNLAEIVPLSLNAKYAQRVKANNEYNAQVDSGVDAELAKQVDDRSVPFAALVRDALKKQEKNPEFQEKLQNGLAMYLLMGERLRALGYENKLSSYITHTTTPDQVLGDLADKIGVNPLQVRKAALHGGIEGVGQLLGIPAATIREIQAITRYAAAHDCSDNAVENWHVGRQLVDAHASIEQKMAAGLEARIQAQTEEYRKLAHYHYDVPEPVKKEEKQVADSLNLLEPVQRVLMHLLGYEICKSPDMSADDIAFHRGINGLHRTAANNPNDPKELLNATYRIYYAGRDSQENSDRTLVHECAHALWPSQFSPEEIKQMDALIAGDKQRFTNLNRMLDEKFTEFDRLVRAYHVGNEAQKAAIAATAQEYAAPYGVSMDAAILPYIRDVRDLKYMVKQAVNVLEIDSTWYAKMGYHSPQDIMREMVSRAQELKQVRYRSEPQLLHFVMPGFDQVIETHYLPHLERQVLVVEAAKREAAEAIAKAQASAQASAQTAQVIAKMKGQPVHPLVSQLAPAVPAQPDALSAEGDAMAANSGYGAGVDFNPQTPASLVQNASIQNFGTQSLAAVNVIH